MHPSAPFAPLLHPRFLLHILRGLLVRREPDAALLLHVVDQEFERDDARPVAADVRMHRQHEPRAVIPGLVEFIDPYLGTFPRRSVVRALHVEERRIVQDPLDRYFDDSRWLAVL